MLHCVVRGGLRTQRNQGMFSNLKGFHFFFFFNLFFVTCRCALLNVEEQPS